MRKYRCLLPLVGLLFLTGCPQTYTYNLRQSLDEVTLTSITPNDTVLPNFEFHSDIQDPFSYVAARDPQGDAMQTWQFPVNQTIQNDLHDYIQARFPKTSGRGDDPKAPLQISVNVSTLTASCSGDVVTHIPPVVCDTSLTLNVHLKDNASERDPRVITISNEAHALDKAIEGNINKAIILLDKYLASAGL